MNFNFPEIAGEPISPNPYLPQPEIEALTDDEKVERAVLEIVKSGVQGLYFTCGHAHSNSPYRLEIKDRVVQKLNAQGYTVKQIEDRDDGSSIYGPEFQGFLDGVRLYIDRKNG